MNQAKKTSVTLQKKGKSKQIPVTNAVMACAAAVFLTFSYTNQVVAQTIAKTEVSNNEEKTQDNSFLARLTGEEVSYQNAHNLVTMERPTADNKRIFLLYNVGTKKFLNLGGYWGTHAALSDTPRFLWLQRRNETKQNGVWANARYPEKEGETLDVCDYVNPLKKFLKLSTSGAATFQVGSAEGSTRTHAVYTSVVLHHTGIVDSNTSSENVLKPNVAAEGVAFSKSFSGNLADKVINADIDLSTCNSGENENILSIGTDIANTSGNNIHLYYNGTNISVTDGTTTKTVAASGKVNIHLHKNGLYINNTLVEGFDASNSVISALAGQDEPDKIEVGSKVGEVRSYATYSSLTCNRVSENVVNADFESNSEKFIKYYPGSLKDYNIEAEIDLSKCTDNQKNILSIGTNIAEWGKTGNPSNIHIEYNSVWGSAYIIYGGSYADDSDCETVYGISSTGTATIKLNATDGLTFTYKNASGEVTQTKNIPASNATIKNLLEANELQVGSAVDNRTDVIYKNLTVKKAEKRDITKVVEDGYVANGTDFSKNILGTLDNKTIIAEMDLNSCTGENETILSIGSPINEADNTQGAVIHFFYTKGESKVTYKTYGQGGEGTNTFDISSDTKKLTIKCINGVFTYNTGWGDWPMAVSDNITNYLKDDSKTSSIDVGSTYGTHSHATYQAFTVENTAATQNAKPLSPTSLTKSAAVATYAAKSGAEDSDETIYEKQDVNQQSLNQTASDINFAKGDYIEATIDLSKCQDGGLSSSGKQTKLENVFSIGKDITTWGNNLDPTTDGSNTNLHIYYIKKDETNSRHCLYVAFVNKDHSDDLKRIFYVPTTGDNANTMKLKLSKDGLVINGQNIYPDINPIPTINYTKGLEGEVVRFKMANTDNNIYEIEDNHLVPVKPGEDGYDTAHGMNTTYNGYLYTTESRSANSGKGEMPFFITSNFSMNDATENEGQYLSWAPLLSNDAYANIGVFGDRALPQKEVLAKSLDLAVSTAQWHFEPVGNADDHTYRICLKMNNVEVPVRELGTFTDEATGKQTNNYKVERQSGNFYLQATTQDVYSDNLYNYHENVISNATSGTYDGAEAIWYDTKNNKYPNETGEWKLVSLDTYLKLFDEATTNKDQSNSETIDITYQVKDPSFSRRNADLKNWKMDEALNGKVRIGYDQYYKKSTTDEGYSDENGYWARWEYNQDAKQNVYMYYQGNKALGYNGKISDSEKPNLNGLWTRYQDTANGNHARYMGVDVLGEANGNFYQEMEFTHPGWYTIKCGGFTTGSSKLFANYTDKKGTAVTLGNDCNLPQLTSGEYEQIRKINKAWPFDYNPTITDANEDKSTPMYNALVYINDENLKDDNSNGYTPSEGDEAKTDKQIHEAFNTAYVRFYISPKMLLENNNKLTVKFGIKVNNTKATGNDVSVQTVSPSGDFANVKWTVFDNFSISFGGTEEHRDLILDEDKEDLDYLDKTIHSYRTTATNSTKLYLHRTFTKGNWNTIMLPVGLTKDQFNTAFGENAKLAELQSLDRNEIKFKTVTDNSVYQVTDVEGNAVNESYMLKPMTPYIIKVVDDGKEKGSETKEVKETLYYWDDQQQQDGDNTVLTTEVSLADGTPYYTIEGIDLLPLQPWATKLTTAADYAQMNYKWNFRGTKATLQSGFTTEEDANGKSEDKWNDKVEYPFVMTGQVANRNEGDLEDDEDGNYKYGKMTAYGLLTRNYTVNGSNKVLINTDTEKRAPLADSYLLNSNAFRYYKAGIGSKAFRCFFYYDNEGNKPSDAASKPMFVLDGVDMTTGIDNIMDNDEGITPIDLFKGGIYNLGGQLVSKDASAFDHLPKGIYIVDGKKVIKN